jgi:hypothetical protein
MLPIWQLESGLMHQIFKKKTQTAAIRRQDSVTLLVLATASASMCLAGSMGTNG